MVGIKEIISFQSIHDSQIIKTLLNVKYWAKIHSIFSEIYFSSLNEEYSFPKLLEFLRSGNKHHPK